MPEGFIVLDAQRTISYMNATACEQLEVKSVVGKPVSVIPELKKVLKDWLDIETFGSIAQDEINWNKGGKWLHFSAGIWPQGICIFIQDRTEQKAQANLLNLAHKQLQQYKDLLVLAQKAGDIGMYEWKFKKKKLWWSSIQSQLYGKEPEEGYITVDTWKSAIHPEDKEKVLQEINTCIAERRDYKGEFRVILKHGKTRWLRTRAIIDYSHEGRPIKMVGITYDFTSRKLFEESLKFKAEATKILSSSLSYEATLQKIAQLAVKQIADWCIIELLNQGELNLIALEHKNVRKKEWARKLRKKYPPDLSSQTGVGKVISSKSSLFYPEISEEFLRVMVKNPEQIELLQKVGIHAVIIVPIMMKSKVVGVITLISSEKDRPFTQQDLSSAEEIASRVTLAMEQAQLYTELRKERRLLKDLITTIPGIVWELKGDPRVEGCQITYISQYAKSLLGYDLVEWINNNGFWMNIIHEEDRDRVGQQLHELYKEGEEGAVRYRWISNEGVPIWVESHIHVITDRKGHSIGMRGVAMNISERVEIEKRKDEFISVASHELKTPLTTIKAYAQLLKRQDSTKKDATVSNYLDRMNVQVDKLTGLIYELLDSTRIQAGKLTLNRQQFLLTEVISEVVNDTIHLTGKKEILFDPAEEVEVYADKDRIVQVVTNLLTNAVKFSPQSSPISIQMQQANGTITVCVQDKGPGVAKVDQQRIFNRYFQTDRSRKISDSSLGLGLYISKEIIERHNGEIWVESVLGKGAKFCFSLPI